MKPIDIAGSIALSHPRIGAMITGGAYVQPLALTVQFQFSTTTINTDVQGTMSGTPGSTASVFSTLFVCTDTVYTVQRPNWMAGSVMRGQDEYYNSLRPSVNLTVQFNGPAGFGLSYSVNISGHAHREPGRRLGGSLGDPAEPGAHAERPHHAHAQRQRSAVRRLVDDARMVDQRAGRAVPPVPLDGDPRGAPAVPQRRSGPRASIRRLATMAAVVAWPAMALHGGVVREFSLSGPDPQRVLPGVVVPGGPVDTSGLGFVVNGLARIDGDRRLIRHRQLLAVCTIGEDEKAWLRGVRQYLSVGGNTAGFPAWVEQPVQGPAWQFSDTYVIWHLSWAPGVNAKRIMENGSNGIDGYNAFSAWGSFYDLRFPWNSTLEDLDAPIGGPGSLLMWVEFTQSDPATRPQRSPGPPGAFTDPDNQFTQMQYPGTSVFYRVAGALRVERGLATDPGGQ